MEVDSSVKQIDSFYIDQASLGSAWHMQLRREDFQAQTFYISSATGSWKLLQVQITPASGKPVICLLYVIQYVFLCLLNLSSTEGP